MAPVPAISTAGAGAVASSAAGGGFGTGSNIINGANGAPQYPPPSAASTASFDFPIQPANGQAGPSAFPPQSGAAGSGGQEPGLWAGILKEASSSKTIACKNVLVLGESKSGKSSIITNLRQSFLTGSATPIPSIAVEGGLWGGSGPQSDRVGLGLALSFTYADVALEGDDAEEPAARLGVFELEGDDPAFGTLSRFALSADKLEDAAVIICLDWSQPWRFFECLERYLVIIQQEIEQALTASPAGRRKLEDLKDRLETFVRDYREPEPDRGQAASAKVDSVLASAASQHMIPLGPGLLTNNLGIPIIVACTKADRVTALEKSGDFADEQFDFVQQSLRTLCLKYGATLCYTSLHRPESLHTLKTYLLHRLLYGNSKDMFPFVERAQVVDRDNVFVPSGWDSWGKIKVQGESFSCEALAGFEDDGSVVAQPGAPEYRTALARSRAAFEREIGNPFEERAPFSMEAAILAEDEQAFLERNQELLNSMAGFNLASGPATPLVGGLADLSRIPSTSASNSDMLDDVSQRLARLARLREAASPMTPSRSRASNDSLPGLAGISGTPGLGAGSVAAGGASQNEVLANFFQSLLSKKTASGSSVLGGRAPSLSGRQPSLTGLSSAGAAAMMISASAGGGVPSLVPNGSVASSQHVNGVGGMSPGNAAPASPE